MKRVELDNGTAIVSENIDKQTLKAINKMTELAKKQVAKQFDINSVICSAVLKLNHIVFWWYYKRVPKFFHKWTILKSVKLLVSNYEHAEFRYDGLNEVLINASKREVKMRTQISNLELKLMGISQDKIDPLNAVFGTDLKGKSNLERDN